MNAVYMIFAAAIALLLLPVVLLVILAFGPAAFVFVLIAAFALPVVLVAGGSLFFKGN